jgi:hypothetical protein
LNYFVKQHTKEGEEPSEICLMKSIFKSEKYKLISKRTISERANEKKTTQSQKEVHTNILLFNKLIL